MYGHERWTHFPLLDAIGGYRHCNRRRLPGATEFVERRAAYSQPVPTYRSAPVDGFRLAYDRSGAGPAVVLLHSWPGDRTDFRAITPLLGAGLDVVVADLRGFGESDKRERAAPARRGASRGSSRS